MTTTPDAPEITLDEYKQFVHRTLVTLGSSLVQDGQDPDDVEVTLTRLLASLGLDPLPNRDFTATATITVEVSGTVPWGMASEDITGAVNDALVVNLYGDSGLNLSVDDMSVDTDDPNFD